MSFFEAASSIIQTASFMIIKTVSKIPHSLQAELNAGEIERPRVTHTVTTVQRDHRLWNTSRFDVKASSIIGSTTAPGMNFLLEKFKQKMYNTNLVSFGLAWRGCFLMM